jgi:hypothetical protein
MSAERPDRVSVIDPITPAIDRAKLMLFRPFDLMKWFVIGFCAWLAYLGSEGGGFGGGSNFNIPSHKKQDTQVEITDALNKAKEFTMDNLSWIIPVTVIVVVVVIIALLVITWLNSRGRFMFLHCVAENKAEVVNPWCKFQKHANSLFLFRIILGIISFLLVGLPILGIVFFVIMLICKTDLYIYSIPGIAILGTLTFITSIAMFLIKKFTMDFVVPIMFLQTSSIKAGWRIFVTVLSANALRFVLYLLFQIVMGMVIGAIIAIGACIGCCLCCISALLFIPYIGTVILLPFFVFKRSYSLYYLRQFGPAFDVFGRVGS